MNETVAKLVELLFQDVEMNDEVRAIHDEVMDNCQERFGDLLNRGLTEDEAIAAVVESLKGMEEVLAGYPRKAAEEESTRKAAHNAALDSNGGCAAFSAQGLRRLSVSLQSEDVTIERSPDNEAHVICSIGENEKRRVMIMTEMVDGELRVTRENSGESSGKYGSHVRKHVHLNGADIDFSVKDFSFESLGDMIGKLMRSIQVGFDSEERVRIQVPEFVRLERVKVQTTSGDVGMDGVMADTLDLSSRSGDLRVELPGTHRLDWAELHTTSGDMEAWLSADRAVLESMSGDMRYVGAARMLDVGSTSGDVTVELNEGRCEHCKVRSVSGDVECAGTIQKATASTTSGDVELCARSEAVSFSSVSGDIRLTLEGDDLRQIDGHTTSGDVTIRLPQGVRAADVSTHTTSGDVRLGVDRVSGTAVRIGVNTVSGDINIR